MLQNLPGMALPTWMALAQVQQRLWLALIPRLALIPLKPGQPLQLYIPRWCGL
jgi:hypothetical protein